MVGGTTSGYSLIGSRHIAIRPTIKMMLESTPAKIGRRMKKSEKFMELLVVANRRLALGGFQMRWPSVGHRLLCHHGHSRTNTLHTVDHDFIPGVEPIAHNTLAVDHRTQLHGLIRN